MIISFALFPDCITSLTLVKKEFQEIKKKSKVDSEELKRQRCANATLYESFRVLDEQKNSLSTDFNFISKENSTLKDKWAKKFGSGCDDSDRSIGVLIDASSINQQDQADTLAVNLDSAKNNLEFIASRSIRDRKGILIKGKSYIELLAEVVCDM